MQQKLLNKKAQAKQCGNCVFGKRVDDDTEILCKRRGVMRETDSCRRFRYDPLKRRPVKHRLTGEFSAEDFSL